MQELISVIVPVYKVEEYLKKCVESIQKQTYENLEILLIDDGSPDNSGKICDEYAKKDKRIKVIHKENGGLSDARNAGIDVATGEYITFVDSDDFISDDYIEYMYKMIIEAKVKLAICGVKQIWKNTQIEEEHKNTEILTSKGVFENILLDKGIEISAYAKLYHRDLWKEYRFPKGKVYEDTGIIYKIIEQAKDIVYGDKKCYYYVARHGSISKQAGFNKNEEDYIVHTNEMLKFIKEKYPELENAINRFTVYAKFRILRMLVFTKPRKREMEKEYIAQIKKYQKEVFKDKRTPRRDKIAIILLNLGLPVFKITWNIYCKLTGRI